MKRFAVWLILSFMPLSGGAVTPALYSRSAIVYDTGEGRILLEKHADEVAPVASLTKLMTAMVVLDQRPALDEPLTIAPADVDTLKHSRSRLPVGATLARGEMLRLALMASENRAASALSRAAVVGGKPAFVARMNEKASALGMHHTRFEDPTGLTPRNVSSARDLLTMADAASHYALIREFTTLSSDRIGISRRSLRYRNTVRLREPGWGIELSKTGFINEAGHCIVLRADLGSAPVTIVLLGAASNWKRSADLVAIRNWLEGKEVTGAMLQAAYPPKAIPHHRAKAMAHRGGVRHAHYSKRHTLRVQGTLG